MAQSDEATRKLPGNLIRAKFVIWAAGEFQYPRTEGFPGASDCVHNSRVGSWAELAKTRDEMVVIGGYESGVDAAVNLANAGCDVTLLASTPFWSKRTLDPSTELAPFTAGRLQAARDGPHPPTLMGHCRVVSVEKEKEDGGYVVTAVKHSETRTEEILTLQVRRPSEGFGVFLQTSTVVAVENVDAGGAAEQAGIRVKDIIVEIAGVIVEGREPHGLVEAMERVKSLSAKGQDVFEWKLKRPPEQDAPVGEDTVRVKTAARPVLATGFLSGVGKLVNHLFEFTEEALCSSDTDKKVSDEHKDAENDSEKRWAVGARVEIAGLQRAAQHNGKCAVIRSFDAARGRFAVRLEDGQKLSVKPANLRERHEDAAGTGAGDRSTWSSSDTKDLLEQHAPTLGGAVAGLTSKLQLAEAAKAELEKGLSEEICAGGSRAHVAQVAYETLTSNVEQLRGELAAAQAAAQASPDEVPAQEAVEAVPAGGPSDTVPRGDTKLTKCDESTICPGIFLCGPQVRQDDEIFCFVYKYRQRFAVVINEIATRLGLETEKAVAECRKHHMFLDDPSCCKATCGAGSC